MTNDTITLTETEIDDLNAFFRFQLDKEANHLAAFTAKDPKDKTAYLEKYSKFLTDSTINMRTIRVDNEVAGSIAKFVMEGDAEITYWIDKKFWGKGVATCLAVSLSCFQYLETHRKMKSKLSEIEVPASAKEEILKRLSTFFLYTA